ncbi:hypothetical protein ANN_21031 [Periplaneta americana]|uniref:Tc1-like transposase DDE domain-containing protein n=1 Tax=Periplaneta americana TaxID=6978 RepID=A0ABQ8SFI8_PERAM|nr:hypothetical protein ANN_21031 [Periplaneta americana]
MPLRQLPLSRNHQRLRLQWARERYHWHVEWQNVVFTDESHFNLFYNDGRIRVGRYRGERNLRACIVERNSEQTPSAMVWDTIGYNMRSRHLRIQGNLNSNRYIREVLPLLQATPHAIFQKDNARLHVARIVKAFFEERRVSLLPWPARSPDMSPIEHVWDMVVVITEDVQNVHFLLEYRPHIDISFTCEHDPKLQEYCVCPQNTPQFDSEGIPNQAPETNKPMVLNGPTSRNREGSDQVSVEAKQLGHLYLSIDQKTFDPSTGEPYD